MFDSWIVAGTERLQRGGLAPDRARELTLAMLAALEGAFVLARALRSTEPLHAAGAQVADAVHRALEESRGS